LHIENKFRSRFSREHHDRSSQNEANMLLWCKRNWSRMPPGQRLLSEFRCRGSACYFLVSQSGTSFGQISSSNNVRTIFRRWCWWSRQISRPRGLPCKFIRSSTCIAQPLRPRTLRRRRALRCHCNELPQNMQRKIRAKTAPV